MERATLINMGCLFVLKNNRYTFYLNNSKLHNILLHV